MLQNKNLHKFEAACLANLCPDNYEEAKALIPSLEVRSLSRGRPFLFYVKREGVSVSGINP